MRAPSLPFSLFCFFQWLALARAERFFKGQGLLALKLSRACYDVTFGERVAPPENVLACVE